MGYGHLQSCGTLLSCVAVLVSSLCVFTGSTKNLLRKDSSFCGYSQRSHYFVNLYLHYRWTNSTPPENVFTSALEGSNTGKTLLLLALLTSQIKLWGFFLPKFVELLQCRHFWKPMDNNWPATSSTGSKSKVCYKWEFFCFSDMLTRLQGLLFYRFFGPVNKKEKIDGYF